MKRRTTEISNDELVPKHRLIQRQRRSISPPGFETRSKRSREDKALVFPRYRQQHDDYISSKEERYKPGFSSSEKYQHHFDDREKSRDSYHMTSERPRRPPHSPSSEPFDYSLRVANIDYSMTDNSVRHHLFQEFKRFGFVNVKVIGHSRDRHAYINFNRAADAKTACHEMQGFSLHGRQLEIGWSRTTLNRYPDLLTEKFNEPRGSNSRKKEHFDDEYYSSEHSRKESFSGRTRDVAYKAKSHERSHITTEKPLSNAAVLDSNATRTLFVGNLEIDITERELRDIFSPYGRIESVDIKSSKTIAYSFVKFFTINDAIQAKNQLNGRMYGELKLSIGFGKGTPATKVWIGNITCYADVSEIRKELDRFGLIRRVDYLNEDNHCYVHFDSQDAAEAAIASLQSYRFKRTNKLLRIDLLKMRDFGSHEFDPDNSASGYESVVSSTTGTRSEDRYKQRAVEFHKDSKDSQYKPRPSSRSLGEGSPKFSSDRFRPPYRKRDRSPHMHGDYNGEYRSKRSRNGHESNYRSERPREHNSTREKGADNKEEERSSPKGEEPKIDENDETKSVLSGSSDLPPPPSTIPSDSDTALNLNPALEIPAPGKIPIAESAETLGDLAKLYPMAWCGNLVLKNTGFPTRMHLIGGDPAVVEVLVKCRDSSESSSLKITQRLRLEPPRLDEVNKRIASAGPSGHCILIALPGPTPSQSSPDNSTNGMENPPNMQLRPLRSLVSYLKQKEAAGIVALNANSEVSDSSSDVGVLHAFPPCEFAHEQLLKVAPNLGPEPVKEDHIVVLLVKGTV